LRFRKLLPKPSAFGLIALRDWHPRLWWGYETHASYDLKIDAPPGLTIGASARRDPATNRYRATGIRSFGLVFGQNLEALEADASGVQVRVIYQRSMQPCAQIMLRHAVDVIPYYTQRFGFYPQRSLTIVPGEPSPVAGGYPFATALVLMHSMEAYQELAADHWRWITAHEIGHQYWLEQVMAKDPETGSGWLMIGLGLWVDREYARARGMVKLHPARLEGYAATVRNGLNTTIEQSPDEIRRLKFDYNSQVTHNKGYSIISALAAMLGEHTFDGVHARCLREYGGRRMGTDEFRKIAEQESGQDLAWFFTPWTKTNGWASYVIENIEKSEDGGGHLAGVHLKQAGQNALPVPVEARFQDGSRERQWTDRLRQRQTLEFRSKALLTEVVVDPDREFPLVMPPPDPERQQVVGAILDLPWTGSAAKAAPLLERAVKLAIKDNELLFRLGLLLYDGAIYDKALTAFEMAARELKSGPKFRYFWATAWQGMLLDLMGQRSEAVARYQEAFDSGVEGDFRHSQYGLVINRAWIQERLREPYRRE
jgi:tetratricopeptide (TPR) repeat protein